MTPTPEPDWQSYEDEYLDPDDDAVTCTICGGEGIDACDDPIQCLHPDCNGEMCPCSACDGRGVNQVIW